MTDFLNLLKDAARETDARKIAESNSEAQS
jgi:hypothetical protein